MDPDVHLPRVLPDSEEGRGEDPDVTGGGSAAEVGLAESGGAHIATIQLQFGLLPVGGDDPVPGDILLRLLGYQLHPDHPYHRLYLCFFHGQGVQGQPVGLAQLFLHPAAHDRLLHVGLHSAADTHALGVLPRDSVHLLAIPQSTLQGSAPADTTNWVRFDQIASF